MYTFSCPGCRQTISVNDAMQTSLLTWGCPVCGEEAAVSNFEPVEDE